MIECRTNNEPGGETEEPVLAPVEMIREVLALLTEGSAIHYLLSLFKDSAELRGYVVRAALDNYRAETGKTTTNSAMKRYSNDFLPRHGIRIVTNPRNYRWKVVLYENPAKDRDFDFGAEVDFLVDEIRDLFGLGKSEEVTSLILSFLRNRLDVVRKELERLGD